MKLTVQPQYAAVVHQSTMKWLQTCDREKNPNNFWYRIRERQRETETPG